MNLLDRLIAAVAPEAALRRARARAQIGAVRSYEGAQRNRRTSGWRTSAAGPVTEVRAGRALLRDRSRDLVRNNAWARRALAIKVTNQIGTGIRPRAATDTPALNAMIDAAFETWSQTCAPESGGGFYALQALVAQTRAESGEALVLLERAAPRPGAVPLALQVLEPDWLADDVDFAETSRDGWREGIRFSAGARVAYRLWRDNPAEAGFMRRRDTREVPADDVLHIFTTDRPGQIRGVPDLASVMMRMRDLDDYHDAALLLAKVQAVLGAFITQSGGPAASPLGSAGTDAAGNRLEELAPGIIAYLNPGEDVKFLAPQGGGPFADYTRLALHMIAAGAGITYHQLTGDLSQANYSSLRAGSLEFRRMVEQDQWLRIIPGLCQPVWRAFIAQGVLAGVLPPAAENAPAKWTPPRFELVDPNRDTQALVSQVRAGLVTWPEAVSEMGYDPNLQLAEIAETNKKLTAAGIVLDTDPRTITATGNAVDAKQLAAIVLAAQGAA